MTSPQGNKDPITYLSLSASLQTVSAWSTCSSIKHDGVSKRGFGVECPFVGISNNNIKIVCSWFSTYPDKNLKRKFSHYYRFWWFPCLSINFCCSRRKSKAGGNAHHADNGAKGWRHFEHVIAEGSLEKAEITIRNLVRSAEVLLLPLRISTLSKSKNS